jgi:hypothetical protein
VKSELQSVIDCAPFEIISECHHPHGANDPAVRHALELAGVEFIDENGGGPGVRFRKRQRAKQSK